jgi:L-phenylalanine/L-methionine N-acetyltransferase
MNDITIRRARASDAEAFALLMADPAVYGGLLQLPYPSIESWRSRLAEADVPGNTDLVLVAEADGAMAGNAGLHGAGSSVRRRHVMGLGIAVDRAWQRRGVGSALMATLLEAADRWLGCLRIELTVYTDNAGAIALYRKFGFEIEGTHRAYALRDGSYADVHAMARLHPTPPRFPT